VKIRAERRPLAEALTWVAQAISKRPHNPALAGMRLRAEGDHLVASAFDYDVSHQARLPVDVVSEGECLVAGNFLREIVSALKGAEVELVMDDDRLTVGSGRSAYRAQTLRMDDYPALPGFPAAVGSVEADDLAGILATVEHATGRDAAVPILTGILLTGGDVLTASATDRFRMARAETPWPGEDFAAVAPARPLVAAVKGLAGPVTVGYEGGNLGVADASRAVTIRCIDDEFPPLDRFLSMPATSEVETDSAELADAVKRAGMVGGDHRAVLLTLTPGEIEVSAASETSDGAEYVACSGEEERSILLSAQMLADALAAANSERVRLAFTGPPEKVLPVFVRPTDNERVDLLVMPRRKA
jgi:DNA polymerase-3 subunit beta